MCRDNDETTTYWNLYSQHRNYRWFMLSYFVTHIGESLTYVASLSLLEQHSAASNEGDDGKYLKMAIIVGGRLLPNTIARFPGGVLADTMDRKRLMWIIDICGAVVALCYCVAGVLESIPLLYVCTIVQESLGGLYEPSQSAILPQLVGPQYLPKANTLTAIMWSFCFAAGSSLGGFLTGIWGPTTCFLTDSVLYAVSAIILSCAVHGSYSVDDALESAGSGGRETALSRDPKTGVESTDDDDDDDDYETNVDKNNDSQAPKQQSERRGTLEMLREMMQYVTSSPAGPYVLIKVSAALSFGASDVMAVYYSTMSFGEEDDELGSNLNSQRLGYLFAAVGIGCLLGPPLVPDKRSHLQTAIAAIGLLGVGFILVAVSNKFWLKCLFTVLRAAGTATLWVESCILLQLTTPLRLLGRISAIDEALALVGECIGALAAGLLQDHGWTADQVAWMLSVYCLVLCTIWACWSRFRHNESDALLSNGSPERKESSLELEPLR